MLNAVVEDFNFAPLNMMGRGCMLDREVVFEDFTQI
jgi:hypothetical protein